MAQVVEMKMIRGSGEELTFARLVLTASGELSAVLAGPNDYGLLKQLFGGAVPGIDFQPEQPRAFLECLQAMYGGSRLWATPPVEMDETVAMELKTDDQDG